MKELIRFDEETQKTFLKEVQRNSPRLYSKGNTCTYILFAEELSHVLLISAGEGDALSGPSQCFEVHRAVL